MGILRCMCYVCLHWNVEWYVWLKLHIDGTTDCACAFQIFIQNSQFNLFIQIVIFVKKIIPISFIEHANTFWKFNWNISACFSKRRCEARSLSQAQCNHITKAELRDIVQWALNTFYEQIFVWNGHFIFCHCYCYCRIQINPLFDTYSIYQWIDESHFVRRKAIKKNSETNNRKYFDKTCNEISCFVTNFAILFQVCIYT